MAALEVVGVTKTFATASGSVTALNDLSLVVPRGGVFGLLGPNGSGKSTLLRVICGLVHADSGRVTIFGRQPDVGTRRQIGALIDAPSFYPFLTGRQVLRTLARTSSVAHDMSALLDRVGLANAADRPVSGYSLGMKQRLGIAVALITDPPIVILDEPTNGLDPPSIIQVRHLVRQLAEEEGRTVLLTSHLLDEVERTCDRVAILRSGELAVEGQVSDFVREERLRLQVGQPDAALAILGTHGMREAEWISTTIGREQAPNLFRRLIAEGIDIYEARWTRRSLEDLFLAYHGKPAQ